MQVWDMRLVRSSRFWALLDELRVALDGHRVLFARVVTDPGLRSLQQKFTLVPCYMTIFERAWQNGQQRGGVANFMRPRNECTELFTEVTYSIGTFQPIIAWAD